MSDLQSFGQAIPVAGAAAPRPTGDNLTDLAQGLGSVLGITAGLVKSSQQRAAAQAQSQAQKEVANAMVFNERSAGREVLSEAVDAGHLSQQQALEFGKDAKASLDALNQASSNGMNASIRNALERSLRFQTAVAQNPGAAKELAEAYGINNRNPEADTLHAIERTERERLKENADQVRSMAEAEGLSEFLSITDDEEVIDAWVSSPYAERERNIKQSQRRALAMETDIAERAPHAARALSLSSSKNFGEMEQIISQFSQATGSNNMGGELSENLSMWAEAKIADAYRLYPDMPKTVEAYAAGLRTQVSARLEAKKKGLDIARAEYEAQVTRPMEAERLKLDIEYNVFRNSQNGLKALQNQLSVHNTIFEQQVKMARLQDEVAKGLMGETKNLSALLSDPNTRETMALLNTSAIEGTGVGLQKLLNPEAGKAREVGNQAVGVIQSLIRDGGVGKNMEAAKRAIIDLSVAYEHAEGVSPSRQKALEESVMQLASDPVFIDMAEKEPALRRIIKPVADGVKSEIVDTLQKQMDKAARQRVDSFAAPNIFGSQETNLALWRKMGQYMILDKEATNSNGVPQYKLVNNISEALSLADIQRQQRALDEYNSEVRGQTDPRKLQLLKSVTGSSSIADALEQVINSNQGMALQSLDPNRRIEDRDPKMKELDEKYLVNEKGLIE